MERTKWEQIRKHLKNHEKEHSGHDENNIFNRPFFTFLEQSTAGEN